MGKVRRLRKKYHLSKVQAAKTDKKEVNSQYSNDTLLKRITSSENIFAGVDIPFDSLTKSLPKDFDVKSIVSTKSRKEQKLEEQHLKKKVKLKLRHDRFLQKLEVTQEAAKEAKKRKRKIKSEDFKDPDSFKNTQISLNSSVFRKIKPDPSKPKRKPKGIEKMRIRLKKQTSDTKLMQQILKDKKFQNDPQKTIIEYLKQKVSVER